jgi:hypothetical protein
VKKPSITIMAGDVRRDPVLRMCSLEARGLWADIWWLAHEGEPYGALRIKGHSFGPEELVAQVGRPLKEVRRAWNELVRLEVPIIFSTFESLLEEVRLPELYWLRRMGVPPGISAGCGKPAENLRRPAEISGDTPPDTRPLIAQLPGLSPVGLSESNLAGTLFVRRMVREHEKSLMRKKIGRLGGNPKLMED